MNFKKYEKNTHKLHGTFIYYRHKLQGTFINVQVVGGLKEVGICHIIIIITIITDGRVYGNNGIPLPIK